MLIAIHLVQNVLMSQILDALNVITINSCLMELVMLIVQLDILLTYLQDNAKYVMNFARVASVLDLHHVQLVLLIKTNFSKEQFVQLLFA